MSEATEREDMATTTAPVRDTIGAEQSLCEIQSAAESLDAARYTLVGGARRRMGLTSCVEPQRCGGSPQHLRCRYFGFWVRGAGSCANVSLHHSDPRNP